jgi:hypothetical protein
MIAALGPQKFLFRKICNKHVISNINNKDRNNAHIALEGLSKTTKWPSGSRHRPTCSVQTWTGNVPNTSQKHYRLSQTAGFLRSHIAISPASCQIIRYRLHTHLFITHGTVSERQRGSIMLCQLWDRHTVYVIMTLTGTWYWRTNLMGLSPLFLWPRMGLVSAPDDQDDGRRLRGIDGMMTGRVKPN